MDFIECFRELSSIICSIICFLQPFPLYMDIKEAIFQFTGISTLHVCSIQSLSSAKYFHDPKLISFKEFSNTYGIE